MSYRGSNERNVDFETAMTGNLDNATRMSFDWHAVVWIPRPEPPGIPTSPAMKEAGELAGGTVLEDLER